MIRVNDHPGAYPVFRNGRERLNRGNPGRAGLLFPVIEFRGQQSDDLISGHAVQVIIQVQLLDDADKPVKASGRFFFDLSAALRLIGLPIIIEAVNRLQDTPVGNHALP